jgi:two-component system, cell cycle sensor histidine kinase and response regulator CckA
MRFKLTGPLQLTLIYAVLAGGWVVGSDTVVALWHDAPLGEMAVNVGKGSLFVLISSLVLHRLAVAMERRMRASEEERTRKERETTLALARANRLYVTLARANEAALMAKDPAELCREICDALVAHAGMRLACVGWVDESHACIRFETIVGPARGYAEDLVVSVDPQRRESCGPTGQAVLHEKSFVCADIAEEERMRPWRERALAHGLRSSAAVPLRLADGTRGALAIYSDERGFFSADIVGLVEKLASDLMHGLGVLQVRQQFEQQTAAFRESEQRWQFALEGAGDGVWDWDARSGATFFSPRVREMFGYAPGEHAAFEEWEDLVHAEDRLRVRAAFSACRMGETDRLKVEHRSRCKDGSYRWVLVRGKVIARDAAGGVQRIIGTVSDVTETRRASRQLALLEAALQAMPAGIMVTDHTGRVEWVNEGFTQLTGYAAAEVIGGTPELLRSGRHPPEFHEQMWKTIRQGQVWSGEIINRRKDGTEYHEHMIIAPVSYEAEGVTHFIAIKQDITERRQIEQQLLRAQRMEGIGLLAGGIAHDLNNVLAPVLLSVELMRMRHTDATDRRTLEIIESATRRGVGVVRQVLTFARGIDGERAPLRAADLLRELALMIEETFPRDIAILRHVADDTPMIRGDATQLHQVLLNLAVNARDAMPDGGSLHFEARGEQLREKRSSYMGDIPPGAYVVFSVRDNGHGMTEEVREHIFEPFFTTKPRGKGTGLGLPTVLGIVRSHGGFIELESRLGGGSEFRIYLPAMPEEADEECPTPLAPVVQGAGRLVLVCDDEPAVREVAAVVLAQAGFTTVQASHGREAVDVFGARRDEIAAVLMDIMMPLMTGDRAAVEMLQARPDLPLVLMSGLMDHEAVHAALSNVSVRPPPLLRKPFAAQDLLGALAAVLPADRGDEPAR